MPRVSRKLRDQYGYSLIEVLVAIVILTIAILPMVAMFDAGLDASRTSGDYDKTRAMANANLEDVKANPLAYDPSGSSYNCPVTNSPPSNMTSCVVETEYVQLNTTGGAGSTTAEFQDGGSGLTRVTVTVEWDDNNSYTTSGVVAQ